MRLEHAILMKTDLTAGNIRGEAIKWKSRDTILVPWRHKQKFNHLLAHSTPPGRHRQLPALASPGRFQGGWAGHWYLRELADRRTNLGQEYRDRFLKAMKKIHNKTGWKPSTIISQRGNCTHTGKHMWLQKPPPPSTEEVAALASEFGARPFWGDAE